MDLGLGISCGLGSSPVLAVAPVGPAYYTAVSTDLPIAYWRLDEVSPSGAGSVLDYSAGGTYDATPNGGITWGQNTSIYGGGKSALFNGTTGFLTGGASLAASLMSSATWTIEAWFNTGIANGGNIFGAASDSTHRVAIQHFGGKIYTSSTVGGNKSTAKSLGNSWHHVVLTSAGDLYVDNIAQSGTSSASLNSTVQVVAGALNNSASFFNGRLANVAMYTTVLNSTRVAAHWTAAHGTIGSGQTFGQSMNTVTPELLTDGSDDSGQLDSGSTLVADGGPNVLEVGGGTFRSMTFDNPTNYDVWASVAQGTIDIDFKFSGTIGTWMLGQITGKDRGGLFDTNDSFKITMTPTGGTCAYAYANGGTTVTATVATTLIADTWYTARARWNNSGTPTLSLTINGVTGTTNTAIGATNCTAWHHLLIGNDTNTTPTSLRIRNVKVYGSWQT